MDLLARMLSKTPSTRITIDRVKIHPFFKDIDWFKLEDRLIEPPIKLEMESGGNMIDEEEEFLG